MTAQRGDELLGAGADAAGSGGLGGGQVVDGRAGHVQDGQPGGQGLHDRQPEGLLPRRRDEDVHGGQQGRDAGGTAVRAVAQRVPLPQQVDPALRAELGGQPAQPRPLRAVPGQQQVCAGQRRHGPDEHVEAFARDQPADPADHEGPLGQPGAGAGGPADALVETEADGLDPVRYDVDPCGRHPPPLQPGGDGVRHGDGRRAQPFTGQVQGPDPAREGAPLDLALAEGVLGGDGRRGAREAGRDAPVHAGPVQVRVHQVVLAAPDEPHEPGQRPQVPVAAHPQVHDPYPVGAQPFGHRAGVGQRQHIRDRMTCSALTDSIAFTGTPPAAVP